MGEAVACGHLCWCFPSLLPSFLPSILPFFLPSFLFSLNPSPSLPSFPFPFHPSLFPPFPPAVSPPQPQPRSVRLPAPVPQHRPGRCLGRENIPGNPSQETRGGEKKTQQRARGVPFIQLPERFGEKKGVFRAASEKSERFVRKVGQRGGRAVTHTHAAFCKRGWGTQTRPSLAPFSPSGSTSPAHVVLRRHCGGSARGCHFPLSGRDMP